MLSGVVLVLLAVVVMDRPIARFVHDAFGRSLLFVPLAGVGQVPLNLAGPALVCFALAAWRGWRPGEDGWTAIACALAVTIAIAFKDQLKYAFGRTWPETW